jgi:hypothetical protein
MKELNYVISVVAIQLSCMVDLVYDHYFLHLALITSRRTEGVKLCHFSCLHLLDRAIWILLLLLLLLFSARYLTVYWIVIELLANSAHSVCITRIGGWIETTSVTTSFGQNVYSMHWLWTAFGHLAGYFLSWLTT